jgi:hypothetical protein
MLKYRLMQNSKYFLVAGILVLLAVVGYLVFQPKEVVKVVETQMVQVVISTQDVSFGSPTDGALALVPFPADYAFDGMLTSLPVGAYALRDLTRGQYIVVTDVTNADESALITGVHASLAMYRSGTE